MGIERPDDDDAPAVDRDPRQVGGDSPALERELPGEYELSGERELPVGQYSGADLEAERERYRVEYPAKVGAAYRAAWDEAVPVLETAWAEHVRNYPRAERAAPTQDSDGSWHGDGQRELDPLQNAEVNQGSERIVEIGRTVILPTMLSVETEDSDRHLIGLDNYLKKLDRIKEKVADELRPPSELTAKEALATGVPDAVRFTLCYRESGYADGVRSDTDRLQARGFELVALKNSWTSDQYKGINSQWRERESGVRFEVQFHTQVSFEGKELSHKAYERLRSPETLLRGERRELRAFQRQVCAMIQIPQNAPDIENYPREKRDD